VNRDWVLRFNADGPDGLITRKAPGKVSILDDSHRKVLAAIFEAGPIPASHGVVRWRIVDLAAWLHDEFGLSVTRYTLGRELRGLGYQKLSARPRHHGQDADAIPEFKNFTHQLAEIERSLPSGTRIEIWWQDEARVGQKRGLHAAGQNEARALQPQRINGPGQPIFLARYVPLKARVPARW
jgi:transposase